MELSSNNFRSFLAPFIPEKLLFRTLVSTVSVYSKPSYGQICGQKPLPLKSRQLFARSGKRFCLCHCSLQSSFNQVISACKNCTAINTEKSFATTEEIKGSFLHVGTRELDYFIEECCQMINIIMSSENNAKRQALHNIMARCIHHFEFPFTELYSYSAVRKEILKHCEVN